MSNSDHSTGNHLHVELRPGGAPSSSIDPEPWLDSHHPEYLLEGFESPQCMGLTGGSTTMDVSPDFGHVGAAALAGAGVAWVNSLLRVGETLSGRERQRIAGSSSLRVG